MTLFKAALPLLEARSGKRKQADREGTWGVLCEHWREVAAGGPTTEATSDPKKRKIYDQFGEEGLKEGGASGPGGGPGGPGGFGGFSDPFKMFESFFGGGGPGGSGFQFEMGGGPGGGGFPGMGGGGGFPFPGMDGPGGMGGGIPF